MPKFDVVVGNPPFQSSNKSINIIRGGGKKNLYTPFSYLSINICKYNGFVCFITPPGIFKTTNENTAEFLQKTREYYFIEINLDAWKYFKVGTPISYWILEKTSINKNSKIIFNNSNYFINLNTLEYLPLDLSTTCLSIIFKIQNNGEKLNLKRDVKYNKTVKMISLGPLISGSGKLTIYPNDKKSTISGALTQITDYPKCLKSILDSKIVRFWNKVHRYNNTIYFKFINRISIPPILNKLYSDQELYNYFNLTQEEINYIETQIK